MFRDKTKAVFLVGSSEDVILRILAACIHVGLYLWDIFLNWGPWGEVNNFSSIAQPLLHRGYAISLPPPVHECLFSQSGVELLDFCQSDRLKMVSAFSYEQGQTFFLLTLKAILSFPVRCLLMAPTHFSIGLLILSVSSCIWETGPFSLIRIADFFFPVSH